MSRLFRTAIKAAQPLFETRPHLISKGDITPNIPAVEYFNRRKRLLEYLPDGSLALIPGNRLQYSTSVVFYEFRQDPNFMYMTGFLEPNSALLLHKKNANESTSIMFVPENDATSEQWEGERAGTRGAIEYFNADEAYPIESLTSHFEKLSKDARLIFADTDDTSHRLVSVDWISLLKSNNARPLRPIIENMRIVKSENEIDCMRTACEISSVAYNSAYKMRFASEADLAAYLEYQFKINGASGSAYVPVVAGGDHALTIHYVRNDDVFKEKELVLVDAGALYGGYTADISRTWPVGGKFTEPQKQLYEAVLRVNKQCIGLCHSQTGMSMSDLHRESDSFMLKELSQVIPGITKMNLRTVYPHSIGHHVGIDVHDISSAARMMPIAPNHVVTIEPGAYIPRDDQWPKELQGVGIRIEDNIVVGDQPNNMEVLTSDTLKEIGEIEN